MISVDSVEVAMYPFVRAVTKGDTGFTLKVFRNFANKPCRKDILLSKVEVILFYSSVPNCMGVGAEQNKIPQVGNYQDF